VLSDIHVARHEVDDGVSKPIGFGMASTDGSSELVTNEAKGPLRLVSGEYRYTLEFVGAPVVISNE
jgi:hypothetical protein